MKKVENLKPFAESKGWSILELAVKFILSEKSMSVVLPTVTSVEELETFTTISDGNYLNESEFEEVKEMYNNNFYVQISN